MTTFLGLTIAFGILGVTLLVLGIRGRRVDDHRLCGRCRHDLSGLEKVETCPECGRPLAKVRIGNRVRRGRFIAVGAPLLLVAIAMGCAIYWMSSPRFDAWKYAPEWFLLQQYEAHAEDAFIEIYRRFLEGELSQTACERLLRHTITLDDWRGVSPLVWDMRVAGLIGDEAWAEYTDATLGSLLLVRPRILDGDPVVAHLQLRFKIWREAPFTANLALRWMHEIRIDDAELLVDGERREIDVAERFEGTRVGAESHPSWSLLDVTGLLDGRDVDPLRVHGLGTHEIEVRLRLSFEPGSLFQREMSAFAGGPFEGWTIVEKASFEVVDDDPIVVTASNADEEASRFDDTFTVMLVEGRRDRVGVGWARVEGGGMAKPHLLISRSRELRHARHPAPPPEMIADVVLRHAGEEHTLGVVRLTVSPFGPVAEPKRFAIPEPLRQILARDDPSCLDVVLRGSRDAAARTLAAHSAIEAEIPLEVEVPWNQHEATPDLPPSQSH